MTANDDGRAKADPRNRDAHNALRDALKAVAAETPRTTAAPRPAAPEPAMAKAHADSDPDRTALIDRGKPAPAAPAPAQATPPAPATAKPETVPPTIGIRGKGAGMDQSKTQVLRGPQQKPARSDYHQEPVVAWLVIIGGPGLGAFRPVYEGNNTIGRAANQRISIDFGDDAISAEEQAYLRYDSTDRQFLFVPNLAKTNVVRVNEDKPTGAVRLSAMDVITMGRTQLVFVPFCGEEFDWSDLADLKE
jgi:hypothetical protein